MYLVAYHRKGSVWNFGGFDMLTWKPQKTRDLNPKFKPQNFRGYIPNLVVVKKTPRFL